MNSIKLNIKNSGIKEEDINKYSSKVLNIYSDFVTKENDDQEFLGWSILPSCYDKDEVKRIKNAAKKIRKNSKVLVVIGIGGSYLGARAVIESLSSYFNYKNNIEILYAGNNISTTYLSDMFRYLKGKDYSVNVISKSGTTTEPALAFRLFKKDLEKKYGKYGAKERIYVTTDKEKGTLKKLASDEEYETFVIPDNIGGRYSVLTPVGLLPIAVAGIDVDKLLKGARIAQSNYYNNKVENNDCYIYAITRYLEYKNKKDIEIFANYEPKLHFMIEWLKQLFGESEGKDGKGIFPTGVDYSTDLHSLGQIIQEGQRNIFETIINVDKTDDKIKITHDKDNLDGLNFLEGKTVDFVNKMAMEGVIKAHVDGMVPNVLVTLKKLDEESIGELIYFFELACGIYCRLLGVNPFNQPGVEKYKTNMYKLLGKPGY